MAGFVTTGVALSIKSSYGHGLVPYGTYKGTLLLQYACAAVAALTLKLKRQYQEILSASTAYGRDKAMTQQIDALGLLIKELEDAVVILQVKLEQDEDSAPLSGQG